MKSLTFFFFKKKTNHNTITMHKSHQKESLMKPPAPPWGALAAANPEYNPGEKTSFVAEDCLWCREGHLACVLLPAQPEALPRAEPCAQHTQTSRSLCSPRAWSELGVGPEGFSGKELCSESHLGQKNSRNSGRSTKFLVEMFPSRRFEDLLLCCLVLPFLALCLWNQAAFYAKLG